MNNKPYKKCILITILMLFIGTSILPCISGDDLTSNRFEVEINNFEEDKILSNETEKPIALNRYNDIVSSSYFEMSKLSLLTVLNILY